MDVPSMVQRSGDTLIVRSVVSGDQIYLDQETGKVIKSKSADRPERFQPVLGLDGLQGDMGDDMESQVGPKDEGLPQCKIKRNYSCNSCTFFTQNPRYFLTHLRDVHGEKIVINECKLCLYASRHYQKLVRHMKMVHGSTEGIEDHAQARKRQIGREGRKRKIEDSMSSISSAHKTNLLSPAKYDDITADDAPQNRLLKCSLCEFTTLYRAQLVEHEQDEHCKTKFFRCEKCTYVTHIKARFSKHVKYHSMPMIKCVTCDFRTPYKWNLDRHMKNHGGTGPFKCAACNFTADIKQSLTVHEMNHHVPPVGHAAGMSLNRRKNKVGGTDLVDDYISEIGDLEVEVEDSLNNNNNIEDFEESMSKRYKYEEDDQPTDLSQKSNNEVGGQTNKKVMRPVPNLIPIQATPTGNNIMNLSRNFVMKLQKDFPAEKAYLSEWASFLFTENKLSDLATSSRTGVPQLSPVSSSSTTSKKKNSNFFDKLKETLAIDAAQSENLNCPCGHTSKCLSESILHRNSCNKADAEDKRSNSSPINLSVNSTSTRCQYCRHRCKSSADLASHVRNCADAANCPNDSYDSLSEDINEKQEGDTYESNGDSINKHPMENRIFVWNKLPMAKADGFGRDEDGDQIDGDEEKKQITLNCGENGYYGVETAPGYGEVTKKMTSEDEAANSSLKKVYKCPHCSFWASTASRFHVHIVGHLNKKPFECSFCAYRSNWRWDITKHIRLKTIRDPNHKMARVLMNDETGRRNYTKYNKYITLMKVTEEDGDPKLMKSGEMTPHQEASLAFINNNSSLQKMKSGDETMDEIQQNDITAASAGVMGMDPTRLMRLPFFKQALGLAMQTEHQDCTKRSPPPLLKPVEDLVAQNTDFKLDGSEKKTLFRCRKCNYKNASHDMVLSHVKGHYQDAGINLTQKPNLSATIPVAVNSNLCMNNVLAAMCLTQQQLSLGDKGGKQQQQQHQHPLLSGSLSQPPVQPTISAPQSAHNAPGLPSSTPHHNAGGAPKPSEHGETTDEASSGVVTTSGTGVTGWRSPAPYRCGHCHQVSNWKHVIQRHCRLKHNSDIRIETVDRNSSKNSPVYHPLVAPAGGGPPNVLINANNNASQGAKTSAGSQDGLLASNISTKPYASNFSYDQGGDQKPVVSQGTRNDLESVDKIKQRRQQCPSCPFVSESKSQMNYHVSLHKTKPEIFECQTCGFTTSKKQQFIQHKKIVHDEDQIEDQAMDLRANNLAAGSSSLPDRVIYFCQKCPGRFFSTKDLSAHVNLHGANNSFVCKVCTYSTRQEHDLRLHLILHTDTYQEKTERLCAKFAVSPDHARPTLKREPHGSWVVGRATNQQNDLEDSIQKNIILVENDGNHQVSAGKSLLKAQLENGEIPITEGRTLERCSDCPFETHVYDEYKKHIQCHECVSNCVEKLRCFACDFSTSDEEILKEHRKLHVMPIAKAKLVDYYTNYKNLELNLVSGANHGSSNNQLENVYKSESEKSDESGNLSSSSSSSSSSCGHRVILDAATGEIIGERSSS